MHTTKKKREPHRKRFRTNLKALREGQLLTQKEVAECVGIATAYYARVEQGYHEPKLLVIQRIAWELDVDLSSIRLLPIEDAAKRRQTRFRKETARVLREAEVSRLNKDLDATARREGEG